LERPPWIGVRRGLDGVSEGGAPFGKAAASKRCPWRSHSLDEVLVSVVRLRGGARVVQCRP
jgi:hypothetical protein